MKKALDSGAFIIFILSFAPFLLTWAFAIDAYFNGTAAGLFGTTTVYGIEAMADELTWTVLTLTITFVFPIVLLYQSIFLGISYYRLGKANKLQRKSRIFVSIAGLILCLLSILILFSFSLYENFSMIAAFIVFPPTIHFIIGGTTYFIAVLRE